MPPGPTQWHWAIWICAGFMAIYVAGAWLLPGVAAVLASFVAAAALGLLVLAVWQQRAGVRAWTQQGRAWIRQIQQHQQAQTERHRAESVRLRREAQEQAHWTSPSWLEALIPARV